MIRHDLLTANENKTFLWSTELLKNLIRMFTLTRMIHSKLTLFKVFKKHYVTKYQILKYSSIFKKERERGHGTVS